MRFLLWVFTLAGLAGLFQLLYVSGNDVGWVGRFLIILIVTSFTSGASRGIKRKQERKRLEKLEESIYNYRR